ncbi:helix-turn-helix domain-containing protein [Chloroflexota bacterium]
MKGKKKKTKKEGRVMKHKSLRQLAKEMGVSHSYLSQVRHGKRPASDRVVSMVINSEAKTGTSNPLGGIYDVFGGFDSHPLPPKMPANCLKLQRQGLTFPHAKILWNYNAIFMIN